MEAVNQEIKELKQTRGKLKAQLTRFQTFLNSAEDIIEVEFRLKKIESIFDEFDIVQSRLEVLELEQKSQREELEDSFYKAMSRAKGLIIKDSNNSQNNLTSNSVIQESNHNSQLKLPTINLPHFSGNYEEWTHFHDTFSDLVHENKNLTSIQKFYYLKSCLKHDALRIIQALKISDNNYSVAWECLVKRYQNKRIIVNSHVRAIFDLPSVSRDSSISLRNLTDKLLNHMGALKNLKLPTDSWDTLIIHIISSKLDHTTTREWESSLDNDKLPTFEQLIDFLNKKCITLETLAENNKKQPNNAQKFPNMNKQHSHVRNKQEQHTFTVTSQGECSNTCLFCKEPNHFIYNCPNFIKLSLKEKYEAIKRLRLCANCLRPGHFKWNCRSSKCKKCSSNHNTLLHNDIPSKDDSNQADTSQIQTVATTQYSLNDFVSPNDNQLVLLSTAQVSISDASGKTYVCKALLDSGSQINLITKELSQKLKLPMENTRTAIAGIDKKSIPISQRVTTTIKSQTSPFEINLKLLVLPSIVEQIPSTQFERSLFRIPSDISLADPEFNKPGKIDILLGANVFYDLLYPNRIKLGTGLPTLQETALGWLVTGSINLNGPTNHKLSCYFTHEITNRMLDETLTKFWKTEEVPRCSNFTEVEKYCEKYFEETTSRTTNGRFVVRLPFSREISDFGDSHSIATKRLFSLERRFTRDKELKNEYSAFLKEYESTTHMKLIGNLDNNIEQPCFILPHHAVLKKSSTTTRCRVVFDGSAKTSIGISLNDVLLVGPSIQDDLFSIVTRFRLHRYVLSADVKMMFRQVLVHPEDRKYQRLVWRYNESEPVSLFELNTVTYGTASASYLATKVLQKLATEYAARYPRTCQIILNSFYMDDLLAGFDSIEEAMQVYEEITEVLESAKFPLRKWCSNERVILDSILGDKANTDKMIQFHDDKELKTLGISWNPMEDSFGYSVDICLGKQPMTKRAVLAAISRIFDPLGLVGPSTIQAKLFMRQLWQRQISWDESLPADLNQLWSELLNGLISINEINVNRQVVCNDAVSVELHGFSDASEMAYGACIYLVSKNEQEEISSNLLCAKSKVVPQGKHTLPRLELLAATLLSDLMSVIKGTLDIEIFSTFYYSDSTIVLAWLKIDPGKLKTFVANRVSKIIETSSAEQWRHVRSGDNPADLISRGIQPKELKGSKIWWNGPEFLTLHENVSNDMVTPQEIPEMKALTLTTRVVDSGIFDRYSTLSRLQRVVAHCFRFKEIALRKRKFDGPLTVEELQHSLESLIRLAQFSEFQSEIHSLKKARSIPSNSKLISLNPFLDDNDILRVGGRLKHSNLSYSQKHPIILPKAHRISRLIVESEHEKHLHAGVQNLLSLIRLAYWPIDGKNLVKKVVRDCVRCFRAHPRNTKFLMGNLPSARVTPSRPFSKCGVDYAGPIMIKDGTLRKAKLVKSFICIFVCFSTRAIHIELVKDLSTDSFLNAMHRFIARRGKPSKIFSDNGSNFKGAHNYFLELHDFFEYETKNGRIENNLAMKGIQWSFIPAKSPYMGGIWEAAVKSTKFHLKRVLGIASMTYEELYTVLTQIESCLNSRPLSPLSSDPDDFLPLTPAHFLIGDSLAATPQRDIRDININRLSRFQRCQQLAQQFWSRWSKDYLTQLQQKYKWRVADAAPKVGDLVVLKEDNVPPLHWRMARVVQVHPGDDKEIRVVSVKVSSGSVFRRSINKVCFLPMAEKDDE